MKKLKLLLFELMTPSPPLLRWLSFCMLLLIGQMGFAQTIQIGSGAVTSAYFPNYYLYNYSYSQTIYTAAEMTAAGASASGGTITKIKYKPTAGASTDKWRDWVIYLGNTTKSGFTSNSDWVAAGSLSQVFSGQIIATTVANQWVEITLNTPFAWDGSNIIVAIDENTPTYGNDPKWAGYTLGTSSGNKGLAFYSDTINPNPASPPTTDGYFQRVNTVAQLQMVFYTSEIPACVSNMSPVASATNVALNPILSWTDPTNIATSFDLYFGTSTNPPLVANVASKNYTLPILAANTTYYWKVIAKNANGSAIDCIEQAFTTRSSLSYCTPSSSESTTYINNFVTTLGSTNISNLNSGYTPGGYQNNFAQTPVSAFASSTFDYNFTVAGGGMGAAIWIDWNMNGIFEIAERVFSTIIHGFGPYSGSITIPSGTPMGDYRMRVMVDHYNSPPVNPCIPSTSSARTETEDYKITVLAPPNCSPPSELIASNFTSNSADLSWISTGTLFDIKYDGGSFNPITEGTIVNSVTNPYTLGGLSSTSYHTYYVREDCGDGDLSAWAGPYVFLTTQTLATSPYIDDFSTNQFSFVNATQTNAWAYGSAAGNPAKAIYISNNGGATNTYTIPSTSTVHAYRDIDIPSGTTLAELGFDWKGVGESTYDYLRVWMVPATFMPTSGTQITTGSKRAQIGAYFNLQSTWQTYSNSALNVSSFAGQTMRLVFEWRNDGSEGDQAPTAIDNIVFKIPPCSAPLDLSASNIIANSANLLWTSSGTLFDIKYGVGTFNPISGGIAVSSVPNPYTLGGLSPNTSYNYYVRQDCSDGELSTWAGPYSFNTSQIAATIPYMDDFSTNQFSFVNGTQTNKWAYGAAAGNPANAIYISNDSLPSNAYTISSASTVQAYRDIAIPSGTTVTEFGFDWKGVGESCCDYVRVWLVPSSFMPISGSQISAGSGRIQIGTNFNMQSAWQTYLNTSLDISSFAGQTMRLVFEWRNDSSVGVQTPTAIDNIVFQIPTCPSPVALTASNITLNSADLSWTSLGTLFDIKYGVGTFNPITGGTAVNSVPNPYTLGSLSSSVSYNFYVRQDCGSETSSWAGPYSFTTSCGAATLPYLQNFESATTPNLPSCTSRETIAGTAWRTSTAPTGFTGKVLNYSYHTFGTGTANSWFYTSGVTLEAGKNYGISYKYGNDSTIYTERMKVAYGSSAAAWAMSNVVANHPSIQTTTALENEAFFTVSANGVYYFGFQAYSIADQNQLYVDDILIRETGEPCTGTPNAGTATASASSGESGSSVDFAVTGHNTINEGLTYDWEYSTNNGATWISTGTSDDEATYTITGPVGSVLEIRYAVKCSLSEITGYSNIVSFTITSPINYCTPTYTNIGDRVSAVSTTGANSNISYTNSTGGQHFDRTDLIIGTTLGQQFTLNTAYVGGPQTMGVWIDWGNNDTFDDPGDRVAINYAASPQTFSITIPSGATPGNYRLRVRGSWDNHVVDGDAFACNPKFYGNSIDFTLQVSPVISGYVYDNGWLAPLGDPSGVSTASDDITIINGTTILTAETNVLNLTIQAGATLNINSILNLFGDMTIDGDLVFISNANGNGELGFVGGTITGEATVQSYMSSNRSYRMVSSAVTTSTSIHDTWQEAAASNTHNPNPGFGTHITGSTTDQQNGFDGTGTGNPSMFSADPNLQTFVAIGNTDVNTLTVGDPYLLFVRGDRSINLGSNTAEGETVLRAKGTLHTGPHAVAQATGIAGSFAMFGNPYQSAVDINAAFAHSDNVNPGQYYVYDPFKGTYGGYVTVNLPNGSNTDGSAANEYLQPGQAAQFATLSIGSSAVFFEEGDKAPGNFRTTSATGNRLSSDNMLTVQLYTTENFSTDGSVHDSFGIIFGDGLNNEVTSADAKKPMNFYENFARIHNGTFLSIERREMPVAAEVYPLYSSGYNYTNYTLKMRIDGLDQSFLYLDDHFTETSTLLEGRETLYTFGVDATDALSIATDRFSVRTEARLGVDNNGLLAGVRLFPNPLNDNTFYINAPKLNGEQISVSISDLTGRQIFKNMLDCRANTVTVSMNEDLASGVYMVTLRLGGEESTYGLVKK